VAEKGPKALSTLPTKKSDSTIRHLIFSGGVIAA